MPGHGDGPIPARVIVVGEAWGADEDAVKKPFVGVSGQELNRLLHEAGIMRSECYCTNLVNARPPNNDIGAWIALKKKDITHNHVPLRDKFVLPLVRAGYEQLLTEIEMVKPNIIIALGNSALWALTGKWGINRWRGSQLVTEGLPRETMVIPTIHPAAILREWTYRAATLTDLRRAARFISCETYPNVPKWNFTIRPSFEQVRAILISLIRRAGTESLWIDFDFETKNSHIDCIGLSWTREDALCIPFLSAKNPEGYWTLEEEAAIVFLLYQLLTHQNVSVRGQNLLYDCQYSYRYWHFIPRVKQDTMISHHVAFCGMRKSLDFQASLYCDHYVQWKPDKEQWKEGG